LKKKVNEYGLNWLRNYPNPFNLVTTIAFHVPWQQNIRLEVFNLTGQLISSSQLPNVPAGEHRLLFNASMLPGGVYICRLGYEKGEFLTTKMAFLK